MNARMILWLLTFGLLLLLAFRSRFAAAAAYLLCSLIAPHRWWWGSMVAGLPLMDIAVLILAVSVVLHPPKSDERIQPWDAANVILLVLIVFNSLLVTTWAVSFELSEFVAIKQAKSILVCLLLMASIRSERDLRSLILWVVTLIGIVSIECQFTMLRGGRLEKLATAEVLGSNQIGNYWGSLLPLILVAFLQSKGWLRLGLVCILPFFLNVILRTQSRGAVLGVVTAGLVMLFLADKFLRRRLILVGLTMSLMLVRLLRDQDIVDRLTGFTSGNLLQTDASAAGRVEFWKVAMKFIASNPLGIGGDNWKRIVSGEYLAAAGLPPTNRAVHQAYLDEALNWGIVGLLLWVSVIVLAMYRNLRAMQTYRRLGDTLCATRSICLLCGLVSVSVGSLFGDYLRYENTFLLILMASVNYRLALGRLQPGAVAAPRPASNPAMLAPPPWRPQPVHQP